MFVIKRFHSYIKWSGFMKMKIDNSNL